MLLRGLLLLASAFAVAGFAPAGLSALGRPGLSPPNAWGSPAESGAVCPLRLPVAAAGVGRWGGVRSPGLASTLRAEKTGGLVVMPAATAEEFAARDLAFYEELMACSGDEELAAGIKGSLVLLGDALRLYGWERCRVSFNGGKDADVILHLMRAALAKHKAEDPRTPDGVRPQLVYFEDPEEFTEVSAHVKETVEWYGMDILRYPKDVRAALRSMVDESDRPLAFVLGTRRGDPNCGDQGGFAPSSSYMPPFMRVNPVIDWSYGMVWRYLERFHIPFCTLYSEGYTSLGRVSNTWPNPALQVPGSPGEYLPASRLQDWTLERSGREGASAGESQRSPETFKDAAKMLKAVSKVSLVIVGDEVLQAKVPDENSGYAIRAFRTRGLDVTRVVTVGDDVDAIARELVQQSLTADLVITSGGVGPTHDDVTLKAVAKALGTTLESSSEMLKLLRKLRSIPDHQEMPEPERRLGVIPRGSILLPSDGVTPDGKAKDTEGTAKWPLLLSGNIVMLPGVPSLFRAKLDSLIREYTASAARGTTVALRVGGDEQAILADIDALVARHPTLAVGSYPIEEEVKGAGSRTVITLQSPAPGPEGDAEVERAIASANSLFVGYQVSVDRDFTSLREA